MIQLDIPKTTTSVSEIFRVLEKEKENYNILYYTVSQNTLETVRKALLLQVNAIYCDFYSSEKNDVFDEKF